jgi:N-acetylglucosamine-6-phosphate deacetylase
MPVLRAPRVLLGRELVAPGWVRLADDRIVAAGAGPAPTPADLDLPVGVLAPGLVDLQVNGARGHDFADADDDAWREIVTALPATGVTAFSPTIITDEVERLGAILGSYRQRRDTLEGVPGARPLGMHVEGPFLSAERRGAHRADLLVDPTPERVEYLLDAADGAMLLCTLAPEREGALAAIERLVAAGVAVSVGHSDATDDQVAAAADFGASLVTHLFNAQSPMHHRAPGVAGAALADPRLTVGLICDLHHVAPTAVRVAFAAAGDRIALVTDAVSALGMPPGRYVLGGQALIVHEHGPPTRADGAIAGSVLRMDEAVGNAVSCGIDAATALSAATRVPADAVGRRDLGRLTPGARADLVWLDDDWRALATWVGGRLVYTDQDRPHARRLADRDEKGSA